MNGSLVVSTRKGLFVLRRGGSGGWSTVVEAFVGEPVTLSLWDERTNTTWAALRHGHFGPKLHHSTDLQTWKSAASPAYPGAVSYYGTPAKGGDTPSVDTIWALESGGADRPGRLWAGTIPGGLFRSDDNGATWNLVQALWDRPERSEWFGGGADEPGIHSVLVDPRDSDHVTVGVSCGGVWQTRDAGETWELTADGMFAAYMPPSRRNDQRIQDPHRIVRCLTAPDVLWSQHHNGIFVSRDDGKTWSSCEGEPSSFGFGVVVHPADPDKAWFVPAVKDDKRVPSDGRFVVSHTADGGKTFELLTDGLPTRAWDIVYRHAFAIDASGDVLAMGSTTGNLWLSADGGRTWTAIDHHLPPIYAVDLCGDCHG